MLSRQLGGAAVPVPKASPKYRVVIVGGGSAGVSVAGQLLRKLPAQEHSKIAVIEPKDVHHYMPYWTMVGGLGLPVENSKRPMSKVMPTGVQWIKDKCAAFEPESKSVTLGGGQKVEYDVLVVAAGLQQNFGLIPGLAETLGKNGVSSIYSYEFSPFVWKNIQALKRGKAIFTNPATAVNCGGAPQKIAYLAESEWRSQGVRGAIDIEFFTATPGIFACPSYRVALEQLMKDKDIRASTKTNLVEVDGAAKLATFEREDGELFTKEFDFLHVTPPMSTPDFIKSSPLVNPAGYVDVDKETCQHNKYPNVFSLGDCSSLPTSKTYSAISAQAPVVVHNVKAMLDGTPQAATAAYDGYTACPILVGDNRLMLAEFNGYTMGPLPTFWPLDQTKANSLFFIMKRFIFERVYWHFMPIGRWFGKRMIFDPPIKHKQASLAQASPDPCIPPSSFAALKAGVSVGAGSGGESDASDAPQTLKPERLGVVTPEVPGDISLTGDMPKEAVSELAPRYKGWLYLNGSGDPHFHEEAIKAGGCQLDVVPVPGPATGTAPTREHAEAVVAAMSRLPRPLMVQCTSGNRAGAALLLWLCRVQGHNTTSAGQLAQDLDLKFFTQCSACGPVRDWVMSQLEGASEQAAAPSAQPAKAPGYVIQQLFDTQGSSTFTYLVGCPETHEAVLIDPVLGMQGRDLDLANELGFKVKYVLNTHCHADHITSGTAIKKLCPEVQTMISEASGASGDVKLRDGDEVKVGRYSLLAVATPGHTDGCMTFTLVDDGEVVAAFTGDTLLIRGCGRTDFQQGCSSRLYDSIHQRIFTLPGSAKIYPGHDYKGRNLSTVEEERRFNPRLNKGKEEFVKIMQELNLPYPKLMDIAVPANLVDGAKA